jgi:hypothetical protein
VAEAVNKGAKTEKPVKSEEKAAKKTLKTLTKTEKLKAIEAKAPSEVQTTPKPEEKAVQIRPEIKADIKEPVKAAATEAQKAEPVKTPEVKAEAKKEADPGKEFVDVIMAEMSLKGASKKRLIRMLSERYGMDKQKVLFKLKRALITERYAAAHEAGH